MSCVDTGHPAIPASRTDLIRRDGGFFISPQDLLTDLGWNINWE
jgi:hypothetical protein